MTKKQEALDKAKQSWKKISEGWRELWTWAIQVVWWTVWALSYTLLSGWEKLASKISESREDVEWISTEKKERRRNFTSKYNERAKKHIVKAWKLGKKTIKWAWKVIKWWAKTIWHTLKGGYHLVDAWDKAIWDYFERKQNEKWKKAWNITSFFRDNILKLLIATSALWYWWYELTQNAGDEKKNWKEVVVEAEDNSVSNETLLIPTSWYNRLNWKKFTTNAPLTRRYLWWDLEKSWDIVIGDTLELNSANSLHNLWTKKIENYGQYTKDISKLDNIDASSMTPEEIENFRFKYPIDATYLLVVKPYVEWKENRDTMSLEQFIQQTNNIVKEIKWDVDDYDWWLTRNKKKLFDVVKNDIDWESIVAYAMTELCEDKIDWEKNKQLFDLLLKNAGVNFLSKIPAIYDWKTSYWLYQFTEYALYDCNWQKRWASVVNKLLSSDKKIAGSVIDLMSWQDQTKAAYMFALFNLNAAVKQLTDKQAKDLLSYHNSNKEKCRDNMTQLIAMCHHRPADAQALKKWHEDRHKNDIYVYGSPTHGAPYWKASKGNYEALRK